MLIHYDNHVPHQDLFIRLIQDEHGVFFLEGVDKNGRAVCTIIILTQEGKLSLPNKIPSDIGLSVDQFGRMKQDSLSVTRNPGGEHGKSRFF